jgi:hypothetical protein
MADSHAALAHQQALNERTRESWAIYEPHRRRVTDLLLAAKPPLPASLCVLGAGNCNDLELAELVTAFEHVCLVDLDERALAAGVARQAPAHADRIALVGMDVTEAVLSELLGAAVKGYDVVASTCLLTQLFESARLTLGEHHPRFVDNLLALRKQHLRLLGALAGEEATVLLITDFVSSDTVPELLGETIERPDQFAMRLIDARNFFTGANPLVLRRELEQELAPRVAKVELLMPWVWRIPFRAYLTTAIRARLALPK